ncbi:MAG: hypothetical protein UIM27_07955 [Acutalibacteraceae bacterium]|nr:hypothetical protein [Acutalibacteraceae bacterium]
MRNDEDFKKEVFKRWEVKASLEKMRKRRALGSLCIFLVVCAFAVPTLLNMNTVPESNNSIDNGVDVSVTVPENGEEFATEESGDWQIEVDTGEAVEEQDGNDGIVLEPTAEISDKTSGEIRTVSTENIMEFYSLIESVYDVGDYEETEQQERYVITISSSTGDEIYSISEDGYIMKNNDGRWKKIPDDKLQEIINFV